MLDALLVLHADTAAVPLTKLLALIGDRAGEDAVTAAVDDLRERAGLGRLGGAGGRRGRGGSALVSRPGRPGRARAPRRRSPTCWRASTTPSWMLKRLLEGSPMGRTRDAAPGTPDRPVQRLLAAGLLRQVDADTVILPRLVGQVLRGEVPGRSG